MESLWSSASLTVSPQKLSVAFCLPSSLLHTLPHSTDAQWSSIFPSNTPSTPHKQTRQSYNHYQGCCACVSTHTHITQSTIPIPVSFHSLSLQQNVAEGLPQLYLLPGGPLKTRAREKRLSSPRCTDTAKLRIHSQISRNSNFPHIY